MLADISIQSATEIQANFSFELDTKGKLFREFKLSSDGPYYAWSKASFQCTGDTGQTFGLERMPRADGLVALKITSKRPARAKSLTCAMSATIDPDLIGGVLAREETGDFLLSLPLPAAVSRVEQLLVTIHFPDYISAGELRLDDMTAEEFAAEFFPSALTLTAGPIPPRHVKTIELTVGQDVIEAGGAAEETGAAAGLRIESFVGLKDRAPVNLNLSLIIFGSSLIIFLLLLLRGRRVRRPAEDGETPCGHAPGPYLVFPGIGGMLRAVFTLCMVLLFAVFTLSGVFIESLVFLCFAMTLEMRRTAAATREPVDSAVEPVDDPEAPPSGGEDGNLDAAERDDASPTAVARPGAPPRPVFDIRGGRGLLLLALFAAAGTGATLLARSLSLQVAHTLAFAYLLASFFLFLSPELLLRGRRAR